MINLRYHVVSLVAVFLALAVGIVMGSTVIDRAIVDGLRNRVDAVNRNAKSIESADAALRSQLELLKGFATEARDQLVEARLKGVPVLIVFVQGIDRKPVDALRETLTAAQAVPAGLMSFTNKMRLDNEGDVKALATALNVNSATGADVVRRQAVTRLADALDGASNEGSNLIPALVAAGFVTYEAPPATTTTSTLGLTSFPITALRVVLVSGAGAQVGDDRVALPFAQALLAPTAAGPSRVVTAESGQDTPGGRAVFVGLVRADSSLAAKIPSVDDLESPMGQAAAVLAVNDLATAHTGQYGVGPGAQRLLPTVES